MRCWLLFSVRIPPSPLNCVGFLRFEVALVVGAVGVVAVDWLVWCAWADGMNMYVSAFSVAGVVISRVGCCDRCVDVGAGVGG